MPRIQFVIDSGFARISRYSHRSRIQRLPIEPISQASANQRAGRCGRLGPGVCVRLYSEVDFAGRDPFTEPEVLRTSLAAVILRMLVTGMGSVEKFPFVDAPAPRMIKDGYQLLSELGAIDASSRPTATGRQLAEWPVDVRLARMIVEAPQLGCLDEILTLVAALSIQDPRERPPEMLSAADEAHRRFIDEKSDFAALLSLWEHLHSSRSSLSGNQFRKLCSREFFSWRRIMEWFDIYRQLTEQAGASEPGKKGKRSKHAGPQVKSADRYAAVHKALLSGLLSHVGQKQPEDRSYMGIRGRAFHIFPGSGLFGKSPRWLMAAEIVETSRSWGRINAVIQPEWIEAQGGHLLKQRVFDPHWSRKNGQVLAWEQVSLHGLVIVEKRRIQYSSIDPVECRRIFILEGLVRGELDTRSGFMAHNERVRLEVEHMEDKRRRRDVLADEHAQVSFFDARIPQDVNNSLHFERWIEAIGRQGRKKLFLAADVLLREDAGEAPADLFPDSRRAAGQSLPLSYRFEPGDPRDGVTVDVPLELLNTLDAGDLQWLVPGMLRDKVIALIRQLPKPLRRALTPVPTFAEAALERIKDDRQQPLSAALAKSLGEITGMEVPASALDESAIADHFRFLIRVLDGAGAELATGRDLLALQGELGANAQRKFMDMQGDGFNRDGLIEWAFGDLETHVTTRRGISAWPALVDQTNAVGLRLFDTAEEASLSHYYGVMRLQSIRLADKLNYLRRHHGIDRQSLLAWQAMGSTETLIEDLIRAALEETVGPAGQIRSQSVFADLCATVRQRLGMNCQLLAGHLNELMPPLNRVFNLLSGVESSRAVVWRDVSDQLGDLLYDGFLQDIGLARMKHYPRYVRAIEIRLQRVTQNPDADIKRMNRLMPWWQRYLDWIGDGGEYNERLDDYRWLLEEYRVSLFAQQLGTDVKVSDKKLGQAWKLVTQ